MEIPYIPMAKLRKHIDGVPNFRDRLLIKTLYLTVGRASEVAGHNSPSDVEAFGSEIDWRLDDFEKEKVLCLTLRTLKGRKGKVRYRIIALPLNPVYEPWTKDLARHITKNGNIRFNITRQRIWQIVRDRLQFLDDSVHPHSLRHWRLTHLVEHYGFDAYDLTVYAGWTFQTTMGHSGGMLDTYLHLDWRKYFPKLLKKMS